MRTRRCLIVNADDFGLSTGINRGIIDAHEHGVVTSASLMVRKPAAREAAAYCRHQPRLSAGLHVDLGESVYRNGEWTTMDRVVDLADAGAVEMEILTQLARFRDLTGTNPTHLDSHQHVHRDEPIRSVLVALARELGVPLRHMTPGVTYCGSFYGQTRTGAPLPGAVSADSLVALLERLDSVVTELACHPGYDAPPDTMYRAERAAEVASLCDARVAAALTAQSIDLRSFRDLPPQ